MLKEMTTTMKENVGCTTCTHEQTFTEGQTEICEDCGLMINNQDMNFEKEWRYYGLTDTRHTSDPNRCYARRITDRVIDRDVEKMGFSQKIILLANQIYEQVTQGKIYRGNSRKGIIFACIFHAYKMMGHPQSCEHLIEVFQMNRKIGLKGLKYVNLNAPKKAPQTRPTPLSRKSRLATVTDAPVVLDEKVTKSRSRGPAAPTSYSYQIHGEKMYLDNFARSNTKVIFHPKNSTPAQRFTKHECMGGFRLSSVCSPTLYLTIVEDGSITFSETGSIFTFNPIPDSGGARDAAEGAREEVGGVGDDEEGEAEAGDGGVAGGAVDDEEVAGGGGAAGGGGVAGGGEGMTSAEAPLRPRARESETREEKIALVGKILEVIMEHGSLELGPITLKFGNLQCEISSRRDDEDE